MIAYYFPPVGGAGVYRTLKFCKYLPSAGWSPTVISGRCGDPDFKLDDGLLGEVPPGIAVHRIDFPRTLWRRARGWLNKRGLGGVAVQLGGLLDFPCRFREWGRLALDCAEHIIRRERPDVIFSTAPPLSAHLVAGELKRRFGLPWVADFRDPWLDNPLLCSTLPRWQLRRHAAAELEVARSADRCVFTHPLAGEAFRARCGLPEGRVIALTNGYDPEDFPSVPEPPPPANGRYRLVYTGSFFGSYSPQPLRVALELAARERPELLRRLHLVFVGGCETRFEDLPGLEMTVLPRVSHAEALQWMGRAHVLLVVNPGAGTRYAISGKLFEYLAAERPILGLVPEDGTTAEILRRTGAGYAAQPDRPERILAALEQCLLAAREPGVLRRDAAAIGEYTRPRLTAALARVLDRALGGAP